MKIHLVAFGIARGPVEVDEHKEAGPQIKALARAYKEYDSGKALKTETNSAKSISGVTTFNRAGVREGDVIIVSQND